MFEMLLMFAPLIVVTMVSAVVLSVVTAIATVLFLKVLGDAHRRLRG